MWGLRFDDSWLQRLRGLGDGPPRSGREPLTSRGLQLGSAEPALLQDIVLPAHLRQGPDGAFELLGEPGAALAELARALRAAGRVPAWRNEQLAVRDPAGRQVATVERGVVRLLGIATHAVHLLGRSPDGRHWVQQRALDKPDDPGLWDTLVGGMVPAGEGAMPALERETLEEAGLRLADLHAVRRGGEILTRRPSASTPGGYIVERLEWYHCTVPDALVPDNRDGEVAQFRLMTTPALVQHMQAGEFTIDAALMYAALAAATGE
jgi:8-oxo-dGTP pyrophosphatase MutT (NUDIX family)